MDRQTFRILLDVSKINTWTHNLIWISIFPRETKTIVELKEMLMKKFIIGYDKVDLFLQDGLLLDDETILILKQDDVIRLEYCKPPEENEKSFYPANLSPSERRWKNVETENETESERIQIAIPGTKSEEKRRRKRLEYCKPPEENEKSFYPANLSPSERRWENVETENETESERMQIASPGSKSEENKRRKRKKSRKSGEVPSENYSYNSESKKKTYKDYVNGRSTCTDFDNYEASDSVINDVHLHQTDIKMSKNAIEAEDQLPVKKCKKKKHEKLLKDKSLTDSEIFKTALSFLEHISEKKIEETGMLNHACGHPDTENSSCHSLDNSNNNKIDVTTPMQENKADKKKRKRKRKRKVPLNILPEQNADTHLDSTTNSVKNANFSQEKNECNRHVYYSATDTKSVDVRSANISPKSPKLHVDTKTFHNINSLPEPQSLNLSNTTVRNNINSLNTVSFETAQALLKEELRSNDIKSSLEGNELKILPSINNKYSQIKDYSTMEKSPDKNLSVNANKTIERMICIIPSQSKNCYHRPSSIPCHIPEILSDNEYSEDQDSFLNYPLLHYLPAVGTCIAFKSLELDDSYSPAVSEYKKGIIEHIGEQNEELTIKLCIPEIKTKKNVKFENIYDYDLPYVQEVQKISATWSSLIEPRLITTV